MPDALLNGIFVVLFFMVLILFLLLLFSGRASFFDLIVTIFALVFYYSIHYAISFGNISEDTYHTAVELCSQGASIYLDGAPQPDFDLNGIDSDTYSIDISEDKEKIYLRSK